MKRCLIVSVLLLGFFLLVWAGLEYLAGRYEDLREPLRRKRQPPGTPAVTLRETAYSSRVIETSTRSSRVPLPR